MRIGGRKEQAKLIVFFSVFKVPREARSNLLIEQQLFLLPTLGVSTAEVFLSVTSSSLDSMENSMNSFFLMLPLRSNLDFRSSTFKSTCK